MYAMTAGELSGLVAYPRFWRGSLRALAKWWADVSLAARLPAMSKARSTNV